MVLASFLPLVSTVLLFLLLAHELKELLVIGLSKVLVSLDDRFLGPEVVGQVDGDQEELGVSNQSSTQS